jgi:hypothetical protein
VLVGPSATLRSDQQAYNLLVVKKLEPGILTRDPVFRRDPDLYHVPWFLDLHAALAQWMGGDVEGALTWLAWLIGALYLAGHYVFFRALTGQPLPAVLAALGALALRNSLGGEFWGFEGLRSAATRTILAAFTPALLLLFLYWRRRPSFPGYFLLLGGLFNVHPVSAYQLAQATGLAHLWLERGRLRSWLQVTVGIGLFCLGALPFALGFFPLRDNLDDPAGLALARAALDYRFPYLLYPISGAAILSVLFHAALPFAAWLYWRRRFGPDPAMAGLVPVMGAGLVLGLVGPAAIQAVGIWLDRPYLDIQQLRSVRLAYPVLLGGLALLYARLLAQRTGRARVAVALLVLASLVPPGTLIHAFSEQQREAVKVWIGLRASRPPAAIGSADESAVDSLWAWARANTPSDALFHSDDFHFRLETHRATTGSFKDGSFHFLSGSRPLVDWYRLSRARDACRAAGGRSCWFEMGDRLGADYVVVDPALGAARPPAAWLRVWERGDWSVWRRPG